MKGSRRSPVNRSSVVSLRELERLLKSAVQGLAAAERLLRLRRQLRLEAGGEPATALDRRGFDQSKMNALMAEIDQVLAFPGFDNDISLIEHNALRQRAPVSRDVFVARMGICAGFGVGPELAQIDMRRCSTCGTVVPFGKQDG